jgi:hypothetical protein
MSSASSAAFAQETDSVRVKQDIRPTSIAISFIFNDFRTAQLIRNSSLSNVLNNKQFGKPKEMTPGFAISYIKGLRSHVDFVGTATGSFAKIQLEEGTPNTDKFLFEVDASLNLKMLPESFVFTPYLNVGVGASSYNGKLGGFLPLGVGLKLNLFNEAAIFVNSQYRIPVTTTTAAYHFYHGIGIAGVIGN